MFSRRWTQMHWWHSLRYFRQNELLPPTKLSEILLTIGPQESATPNIKFPKDASLNQFSHLITKLLHKYPELRHIPVNTISGKPEMYPENSHILLDFVKRQRDMMKKGFSEEKSFEMVEKLYQDRMQRKKDDFRLTLGAAVNNQARSLMNFYQQQSEYEARLKVLRLERDLHKFKSEQEKFKQEIMAKSSDLVPEDEAFYNELKQEDIPKHKHYTKVLEKVVSNLEKGADASKIVQSRENVQENVGNFLRRSKNVYAMFLDLYCMKDKLKGLKDDEIMGMLRDSPKKFKDRSKLLRKKLDKYNVKLDKYGEIDFSQASNMPENVKKSMISNKNAVKMALMSEDLDFEFEHMEKKREKAMELKKRLEKVEKEEKDSLQKDTTVVFEERKNESYEPKDQKQRYVREVGEWEKRLRMNDQFFMNEDSYRLIETQEEKLFRLEKKWLASKIQELENETNPQNPDQSAPYIERLVSVIDDFRRLKFMIDQETALRAGKALFEMQDSILQFSNQTAALYYEELEAFLKKKIDEKFSPKRDLIDKARIMKMIQPREWDERTLKPYSYSEEFKRILTKEDSLEVAQEKQKKFLLELWKMEEEKQMFFDRVEDEPEASEVEEEEHKDELAAESIEKGKGEEVFEARDEKWKNTMELAKGKEGVGLKEKEFGEEEAEAVKGERETLEEETGRKKEEEDTVTEGMMQERTAFDPEEEKEKLLRFIDTEKGKGKGKTKGKEKKRKK